MDLFQAVKSANFALNLRQGNSAQPLLGISPVELYKLLKQLSRQKTNKPEMGLFGQGKLISWLYR